jgi:hypothetical protein
MSDDDLENDDLEVGDEDEAEEVWKRRRKTLLKTTAVTIRRFRLPKAGQGCGFGRRVAEHRSQEQGARCLAKAMEEFLRGGKVQEVEANVVADPPKKPDNKYGSLSEACLAC